MRVWTTSRNGKVCVRGPLNMPCTVVQAVKVYKMYGLKVSGPLSIKEGATVLFNTAVERLQMGYSMLKGS
jgi:hypothetical protein